MTEDDDDIPESDPYCAHWHSVFDTPTPDHPVLCTTCGHPCTDHLALWGTRCHAVPDCPCDEFVNEGWPAQEIEKPLPKRR